VSAWILIGSLNGAVAPAETAPQNAEALTATQVHLGNALRELDRNDEAVEAFRQALAAAPDDFAAHLGLGSTLAEEEDLEEALVHLERATELRPEDAEALYQRAEVLRRLLRWEEALDSYRKALALDGADENSRIGEADALFALGRFTEARTKLEEGRQLLPESRGFKFGLTWLLAACPDKELRDPERALTMAQELYAERRSIGAAELIAAATAELGQCEEAAGLQRFVLEQAVAYERPPEVMARLELAASWFAATPCGVPAGRPASERPEWPRRRPD
jgi:tetratricopeptide (TPR) repeat protein